MKMKVKMGLLYAVSAHYRIFNMFSQGSSLSGNVLAMYLVKASGA